MAPIVSVIMPAYNAQEFIGESIASVLAQTFENFELIVIDDGSTDGTASKVAEYANDARVRFITQNNCGGPSKPRNVGIAASQGELIAFCDSDDVWEPEHLKSSARLLSLERSVSLCFSNFRLMLENERESRSWFDRDHVSQYLDSTASYSLIDNLIVYQEPVYDALIASNFIHTSTVVVRKKALLEAGDFDEGLVKGEDWDVWLRMARTGAIFGYCSAVNCNYRIQNNSVARATSSGESYVKWLAKTFADEPKRKNRLRIADRIAQTSFHLGYAERCHGNYGMSKSYYCASFRYGNFPQKLKAAWSLLKLAVQFVLSKQG